MNRNSQSAPMGRAADMCSIALSGIPAFPGKIRIANALARIAAIEGRGWGTCSLGGGATIRLNLTDRIERQMWGGCYEPHVQRALRTLLSAGDVFLDIGAHIGYHAVLGALLVGPRGAVIAFEPDPANFSRLRENLQPFPWSTPLNKAVWSGSGAAGFQRSSQPGESGWGTLTSVRDLAEGDHLMLEAISLDDWLSENRRNVSVMKVDAEGSEAGILRGGREFLKRTRPAVIIEANDVVLRQAQTSARELRETMEAEGFEIFSLGDARLEVLESGKSRLLGELLALPKERAHEHLARFERCGYRVPGRRPSSGAIQ